MHFLCDIDDFKNVNDKYGHECGDMILEKIANIIQKLVEGIGYAARWGGEEILIL
ncbi:diguanylate cyclase domain-containing protein, partial [Clostridium sp.]